MIKTLLRKFYKPFINFKNDLDLKHKLQLSYSRASMLPLRNAENESNCINWEFSGFSQNGEDGIIEVLLSKLKNTNRYFIEIGIGDGIENNTAYLGHIKKFSGLMVDGDISEFNKAYKIKPWLVECLNIFVNQENINKLNENVLFKNPDVFSLDIDGMDYYILKMILENGFRPKIIVVEYNSAFGPDMSCTLPYNANFNMFKTPYTYLYYGVSINGWKTLLNNFNYKFITVESNGVNAFFVDANEFDKSFLDNLNGLSFAENKHQFRLFKGDWKHQFDLIKDEDFFEIS